MYDQKHFTVPELAKQWKFSPSFIRSLFENEDDVLKIVRPELKHKRGYTNLRIPESVARRVHARLSRRTSS